MAKGQHLLPGREVLVVNPEGRSKGKVKMTVAMRPVRLSSIVRPAETLTVDPVNSTLLAENNPLTGTGELRGTLIGEFLAEVLAHDSVNAAEAGQLTLPGWGESLRGLWESTGLYDIIRQSGSDFRNTWLLGVGRVLMILVGIVLLYLAIVKE